MKTITIQEFQQDAVRLIDLVQAGERIVLTKNNAPVAEVSPVYATPKVLRPIGLAAGQFTVPDDFDGPLPEDILKGFEGS